ncbi:MAG: tRNA (N6-threonylcarbamoyladenosine(37)-N6)-methyltransferase TrmO [Planctomycetes bacterium]|nr:tRNA (N6-threonylcarbamoyladenosine(37)-N6)-methyltransferase TrmO [Planctomycetota bacterium]
MKRRKANQDHRFAVDALDSYTFNPIGIVHSPYTERFGTPRQPTVVEQVVGEGALDGRIELFASQNFEQALEGLDGFEYCWVLSIMHLNEGWKPKVRPPRGGDSKRGLFATRSPHRPNPIALSALKLVGIEGRNVHVRGIDLIDGTPILDLKPYVPYADAFPNAKAGWIDQLEDPLGPDFHPDNEP